ncbi:PAXNEB-domain-containing protein [Metschnikowia bicuspidata var. bicuspidata NRRL YB-4993]|uniref:Elongator complex protein 4 n=1 Tax=Metschnikowia bicuspidata var. bicuspidata NRRL YB-4993 TaxID=869754 RepID=A0A1A0H9E0_9ASCO|nr:PAXNEB-domain-containing protein [Metschnikowia bicuspidata var. bicuspidata NRRL YB-4993]OBA20636.1 PAXNEB-domain-containing protein [Metschnikowia bicuspidata var. bicuspidata NRRL YB-4993]
MSGPQHVRDERAPQGRPRKKSPAGPGVRPSSVSSQPTVSSGCADLDRLLGHQGLPLSSSLLVEESGATDFAAVLMRAFVAQGVVHHRAASGSPGCHVVVVGPPADWAKDLPGEYRGSAKDQKKARLARDASQVSVANLAERDLKIAWRYGLSTNAAGAAAGGAARLPDATGPAGYVSQFDITQRLVPGAGAQEITFVPVHTDFAQVAAAVAQVTRRHTRQGKVVRIAVPGFLSPALYPPQCSRPTYVVPLVHLLRGLLAAEPAAVLMMTLALDLYPRAGLVAHMVETLVDGVVHLQPFNPDMAALIERAYKNEPAKIQHGLVHVVKVPWLSARGMMMEAAGEYAFKNGRKKFEIDDWGIPVDDAAEPAATTQNVDF